jgi:hypothetical protein
LAAPEGGGAFDRASAESVSGKFKGPSLERESAIIGKIFVARQPAA